MIQLKENGHLEFPSAWPIKPVKSSIGGGKKIGTLYFVISANFRHKFSSGRNLPLIRNVRERNEVMQARFSNHLLI